MRSRSPPSAAVQVRHVPRPVEMELVLRGRGRASTGSAKPRLRDYPFAAAGSGSGHVRMDMHLYLHVSCLDRGYRRSRHQRLVGDVGVGRSRGLGNGSAWAHVHYEGTENRPAYRASPVEPCRVGREILPRLAEDQSSGVAGNRVLSDVSCDIGVAVHGIRGSWTLRRIEVHRGHGGSRVYRHYHFLIGLRRGPGYREGEAVASAPRHRPCSQILPSPVSVSASACRQIADRRSSKTGVSCKPRQCVPYLGWRLIVPSRCSRCLRASRTMPE